MKHTTQKVIGIIGDGQLALMLAESLGKFQLPFKCLATQKDSPMMRAFPQETTLSRQDFTREADLFTLENEFLTPKELKTLLGNKVDTLFPDLDSYSHFADKISQRKLYESLGLPSPKWMALEKVTDLIKVASSFPFPFVLKASQGGYDGKGVKIVSNLQDFEQGLKNFGFYEGKSLLIEEKVQIKQEVAQGFVHSAAGMSYLPLVDTVQESGVCNFVYYPAEVSLKVRADIELTIKKLGEKLSGIFNFEFFIDHHDNITINEGAPRPHNSQHLTIDASNFSQFDLVALHMSGREVPATLQTHPSGMINILGKSSGDSYKLSLPVLNSTVEVHPKLYQKEKCVPGRKMGHVNIVDETGKNDLRSIAQKIFKEYYI